MYQLMYQFYSILFILYRIENFLVRDCVVRDLSHTMLLGVRELSHATWLNSRSVT